MLLISNMLSLLPQVLLQWCMALGRADLELKGAALALVAWGALSAILLPVLGAIGVAVPSICANALSLVFWIRGSRNLAQPPAELLLPTCLG